MDDGLLVLLATPSVEVFLSCLGISFILKVFQFYELVTKVPTITTEGSDDREKLVSYRGGKQDPPGYLL